MSAFRASPADCLRDLRGMGATASLVVAVVVDGSLSGVCAGHSYTRAVHPVVREDGGGGSRVVDLALPTGEVATLPLSRAVGKLNNHKSVSETLSAKH